MSEQEEKLGPDFARGVPLEDLAEGRMILGQVAGEAVVLARSGGALFAIGAECTHYHGPLADGMLVADTVRCPWHHACFSLRTGEALRAPALNPVACWRVEQQDGKIYVREKLEPAERRARTVSGAGPESIVIIGGGAAGNAAAEMLRREGYAGPLTMLSADDARPYDRPNLSKDYLDGSLQGGGFGSARVARPHRAGAAHGGSQALLQDEAAAMRHDRRHGIGRAE